MFTNLQSARVLRVCCVCVACLFRVCACVRASVFFVVQRMGFEQNTVRELFLLHKGKGVVDVLNHVHAQPGLLVVSLERFSRHSLQLLTRTNTQRIFVFASV